MIEIDEIAKLLHRIRFEVLGGAIALLDDLRVRRRDQSEAPGIRRLGSDSARSVCVDALLQTADEIFQLIVEIVTQHLHTVLKSHRVPPNYLIVLLHHDDHLLTFAD